MGTMPNQLFLMLLGQLITFVIFTKLFGMFFIDISEKLERIASAMESKENR
jgi:hypothetical protein